MVENEMTSKEVAAFLNITINNLRQIQYRKSLQWRRKEWRDVYYLKDEVMAYAAKRDSRKQG